MAQSSRPAPDAGIALGEVLLGKYRVESILGSGGMGVVVKCVHIQLEKYVAIKMLRQDVLLDQDAKERFLREAQSASKLRSEHVAKVEDVGHFPDTGVPYMVMEFLDGHDLGDLVDERGAIAPPFATMLMLQAAEALAEAHSRGIVHRDVKPSNLFVTWRPDGSAIVKVLDFGISKSASGTDMRLTQTQSLLGTPAYMSPEQMRSARLVDARTDIWSFGTVFYELLEGRRPFEAESFSEMCVKVAVDPPAPMINTPPELQPIILRCLAKSPDQRYASMAELGRDLMPHVQDVHQASLLVERMQRVLGRASQASGETWEGPSTGVNRTPVPVTDLGSAPVAMWRTGTDPAGVSVPTPSPFARHGTPDPRTPVATIRDAPSRPYSEVGAAPKRSNKPFVFLAAFVAIGIAIGLAWGLSGGNDDVTTERTAPPDKSINETKPAVTDPLKDPAKDTAKEPAKDPAADTTGKTKPDEGSGQEIDMQPDPPNVGIKPPPPQPPRPPINNGNTGKVAKPLVRPNGGQTTSKTEIRKTPDKKNDALMAPTDVKKPVEAPKCPLADRTPSGGCAVRTKK